MVFTFRPQGEKMRVSTMPPIHPKSVAERREETEFT